MSGDSSPLLSVTEVFDKLRADGRAAFMPFLTGGDPNPETSAALLHEAAARGADLIEVGVPFSDPVADGPTIQASYFRTLQNGFRLDDLFALVRRVRREGLRTPLVCMCAYTLAFRRGVKEFAAAAREAGFSALLFPDLPLGYNEEAAAAAAETGLDLVLLAVPTSTAARRAEIAAGSRGFVYYVSVAGITGMRKSLPEDLKRNVAELRAAGQTPVCVGFGISTPQQAAAVAKIADGVIVGSALVKTVAALHTAGKPRKELVAAIGEQLAALAEATHHAPRPLS